MKNRIAPARLLIAALVAALLVIAAAVLVHAWALQQGTARREAVNAAEQGSLALSAYINLLQTHSGTIATTLATQDLPTRQPAPFPASNQPRSSA